MAVSIRYPGWRSLPKMLQLDQPAFECVQLGAVRVWSFARPADAAAVKHRRAIFLSPDPIGAALVFVPMVFGVSPRGCAAGARFVIVFYVLMTLFYALVPERQGPRHRVQLTFVIARMQFHFFWEMILFALCSDPRWRTVMR